MTTTRTVTIEVDPSALAGRAASDLIPCAISSELPVQRTDYQTGETYLEVLEHSGTAVDLSRAANGLPLIWAHDQTTHLGAVVNLRIGADRKLRGDIKLSRSARGQELAADIADGIAGSLSVGYNVHAYTESRDKKGVATRRYSKWTPHEVSALPVPADISVGAHRSQPAAAHTPHKGTNQMSVTETHDRAAARVGQMLQIGEAGGLSLAEVNAYLNSEATPDQMGRELLAAAGDKLRAQPRTTVGSVPASAEFLNSFCEAIYAPDGGSARESTRSLSKETGLKSRGNFVRLHERTMTSTGAGSGAEFSPVLQGDLVDLMRPRMIVSEFGARNMTYSGGAISLPTITSDAAYSWLAENPASGVAASNLGTGSITLRPHAVATRTTHSAQSLRTSDPQVAGVIMQAHAARLAVAVDQAALAGLGASDQPRGILNHTGVATVPIAANGGPITYSLLCQLEAAIDAANNPLSGLGFATTPALRSRMRQLMDFPSASAGRPLFSFENTVLGHRALTSTSMPSTLSKGSASGTLHSAILGDFSQMQLAFWSGLEVILDPYSDASRGLTHVTSTLYCDVAVLQPGSFACIKDATLG